MQQSYDGSAANVVLLLTDGANLDSSGLSLDQFVEALRKNVDAGAVRIIAIGIGPGADMGTLSTLAEATPGGQAYLVEKEEDIDTVVLDALASRA